MRSIALATIGLLALAVNAHPPHYPPPVDCPAICESSRCPDRGPPHSHPKCIKNECSYGEYLFLSLYGTSMSAGWSGELTPSPFLLAPTACDHGYELKGKHCVVKKCHPRDCYDKIPSHAYPVCTKNACSFGSSFRSFPFPPPS